MNSFLLESVLFAKNHIDQGVSKGSKPAINPILVSDDATAALRIVCFWRSAPSWSRLRQSGQDQIAAFRLWQMRNVVAIYEGEGQIYA
jgi:hypothetical protein